MQPPLPLRLLHTWRRPPAELTPLCAACTRPRSAQPACCPARACASQSGRTSADASSVSASLRRCAVCQLRGRGQEASCRSQAPFSCRHLCSGQALRRTTSRPASWTSNMVRCSPARAPSARAPCSARSSFSNNLQLPPVSTLEGCSCWPRRTPTQSSSCCLSSGDVPAHHQDQRT